jgi:uncharacterized protein (DUF885 family)
MKALTIMLILAMGLAVGCSGEKDNNVPAGSQDEAFLKFRDGFIESLWAQYPGWATSSGYHKCDSLLTIPDHEARLKEIAFLQSISDQLKKFDPTKLESLNRMDYLQIENFIQSAQWGLNEFKSWQWDPSSYNVADGFAALVNETYAPLEERLSHAIHRLQFVPGYYAAAKMNLTQPMLPHTKLSVSQNKGALEFLQTAMADSVAKSALPQEQKDIFKTRLADATTAINDYVAFLQSLLDDKSYAFKDFRIGQTQFEAKFKFDIQSRFSAEEIFRRAMQRKGEIQEELIKLSKELYAKYLPVGKNGVPSPFTMKEVKMVIDEISKKHCKPEDFVEEVRKQIPELTAFVKEKDLLFLDPAKPLVVRETPLYMRGFAGASINAPGPYDKEGNTYYNVTPLDDLGADQAESWLREYNHYLMQVLNIHEAIPGHYAQLVYSNQSPSLVKSILGNGAMVEGWAVYTERMMLEEGYGNNAPELWLMYYKWHLRSVINTILDYSVHVNNISEEDALKLMIEEGFQQEAEAKGKWRRATLSQVQLCSYFTGFTEIYELREEVKTKEGAQFNLRKFNEKFLSYGSSPVKFIREAMMETK